MKHGSYTLWVLNIQMMKSAFKCIPIQINSVDFCKARLYLVASDTCVIPDDNI